MKQVGQPIQTGKRASKKEIRLAIKDKCIECFGGKEEPGYMVGIRNCTSYSCPLRPHRPYQ